MFAERGLRRVTVDDLVTAAGFTRGAFYSNFSSIEELFFAVFEQQATRMLEAARAAVEEVPEGEFSLASIGRVLDSLHPYAGHWYALEAELRLLALRDPHARTVLAEHSARFEGELVEVIDDVLRRLGRVARVPTAHLAEAAVALYLHALGQEALGAGTMGRRELVEQVLPGVVLGLSDPR